ncbi:hypothetical protein DPMN_066595 [Dreissena polymorpha]|uniref:Uncharacterized protein n=1 Tax=Dreissena polymorpha TaxID=45954 RepID=A0A9D3YTT3_DREPO|nr:hypothetical protein DPMN_066595 [Dreissena polymorpha]
MKTAATLVAMFFNKPNLRTNIYEDWAINVTSRVLTSKAAPPPGGHIFQQTETIFKLSLAIIKRNVQTNKTALPPGGHVFLLILTIFKLNRRIQEITVLTIFHEDWTKNVTLERSHKTATTPGGHFFTPIRTIFQLVRDINQAYVLTKNTAPPPGGHVFQWTGTIFELNQHIIMTNTLTKLHEDWASHVSSTVFTSFELNLGIIETNVLTKFHEDRTINAKVDDRRTTDKSTTCAQATLYQADINAVTGVTCLTPPPNDVGANRPTNQPTNRPTNRQGKNNMSPTTIDKFPIRCGHVFQQTRTIFEISQDIISINGLTKFHEEWTIHVTLRVKYDPPPGGHVFQPTGTISNSTKISFRQIF